MIELFIIYLSSSSHAMSCHEVASCGRSRLRGSISVCYSEATAPNLENYGVVAYSGPFVGWTLIDCFIVPLLQTKCRVDDGIENQQRIINEFKGKAWLHE